MNNELIIRFPNNEIRQIFLELIEDDLENSIYNALTDRGVNVDSIVCKEHSSSTNYEGEIPVITIKGNLEGKL